MSARPAALAARLDGQMQLFGRDVRDPGGNILVATGFERIPSTLSGRTAEYRRRVGACTVRLWGFGAIILPPAGPALVLRRNDEHPRVLSRDLAERSGLTRDALGELAPPAGPVDRAHLRRWLPRAVLALARYEALAAPRRRGRAAGAADGSSEWRDLAMTIRAALSAPAPT